MKRLAFLVLLFAGYLAALLVGSVMASMPSRRRQEAHQRAMRSDPV